MLAEVGPVMTTNGEASPTGAGGIHRKEIDVQMHKKISETKQA